MTRKNYSENKDIKQVMVDDIEETIEEISGENPKVEKIANVAVRKKGLFERMFTSIIGPDGLSGIGSYLNREIVVPALKDMFVNTLTSGINMAVYKDEVPRSGVYNRPVSSTKYRYSDIQQPVAPPRPAPSRTANMRNEIEYYEIEDRQQAQRVLGELIRLARTYEWAKVADYYDMIGVESEFTHSNWGWLESDLMNVGFLNAGRDGAVVINLPRPRPVNMRG